jgi:isopentenyl-diphosphate Delta-isomerase
MNHSDHVILVNRLDQEIGTMPKMDAHKHGFLHRAFSVFIFNEKKELLLHRRALSKYHSGGLWTNTCCSHPRPGETLDHAAARRLKEEMGIAVPLNFVTSFIYRAELDNGLTEYEFDHVLEGRFDGEPQPDPEEVMEWKFSSLDDIQKDMTADPDSYTAWFRIIFAEVKYFILNKQ